MSLRGTVVSAMATHLPTGRGSPVSIHGLPMLRDLEGSLRSAGFNWIPIERFDPDDPPDRVIALWDFGSLARLPKALKKAAEGRIVAWSLESPLVAHRGYHRLPTIAREARHVVGYPGVKDLMDDGTATFHAVGWPNSVRSIAADASWEDRDLLVMINSNKRLHQWREGFSWRMPSASARLIASSLIARSYAARRKWRVPDLYNERLRAISELGEDPRFSLFGVGWSVPLPGWSSHLRGAVAAAFRGEVRDKDDCLRRFRFALCIENTAFPGYISEKIFDAFFAGTIPVYLGAPDIEQYVPAEAFIDMRRFSGYETLVSYLESLGSQDSKHYRETAQAFLRSRRYRMFSAERFISTGIKTITEVSEN